MSLQFKGKTMLLMCQEAFTLTTLINYFIFISFGLQVKSVVEKTETFLAFIVL